MEPAEASRKEAAAVLEVLGFSLRNGGENHLVGFNQDLVGHHLFPHGTVTVNCHYKGKSGVVHPLGVKDIIKAARFLRTKDK